MYMQNSWNIVAHSWQVKAEAIRLMCLLIKFKIYLRLYKTLINEKENLEEQRNNNINRFHVYYTLEINSGFVIINNTYS